MGLERPAAAFAAVKTVRWTVFRPWESPLRFRTHPHGCGRKCRIRQVRATGPARPKERPTPFGQCRFVNGKTALHQKVLLFFTEFGEE